MSQVTVTNITITLPVTGVCSGASLITMTIVMASTSVGQSTSGQHDVVLLPQLILRDTMKGSVGITPMLQQQQSQSQMPSQAYADRAMGPLQVGFLFQSLAFHQFICHVLVSCYGVCFLLSGTHVTAMFTERSSHWSLQHCISLEYTLGRHMCLLVMSMIHAWSALSGCSSHCFE